MKRERERERYIYTHTHCKQEMTPQRDATRCGARNGGVTWDRVSARVCVTAGPSYDQRVFVYTP